MLSSVRCSSPSKYVTTYCLVEEPTAIAIILGHLGISSDELKCLAKLYLDRNCAVVAARSSPLDFLLAQHGQLKPVSRAILKEAELLSRQYCHQLYMAQGSKSADPAGKQQRWHPNEKKQIPMVVHMWSNGGAFLWEEMMKESTTFDRIVRPNLQYVAYDSCPCYLHLPWRLMGPFWNDAFPFPGWSLLARQLYLVMASLGISAWCLLTGSLRRPFDFWEHMQYPPCQHLLYLYSANDKLTDASRIDQLIRDQLTLNKDVTVVRFEDSEHCRLAHDHPQEYASTIEKALRAAVERTAKR